MKRLSPIDTLRRLYNTEFITDLEVAAAFGHGPKSNSRLTRMVKAGELIRVKRGLYIFAPPYQHQIPNQFHLANLIYGPSYVSLESALSFYGLIPEAVVQVTSVNTTKPKLFRTAVGRFSYRCIPRGAFAAEVRSLKQGNSSSFLIASPEKSLLDKAYLDGPRSQLFAWLVDSLRIDEGSLRKLSPTVLPGLSELYSNRRFALAVKDLSGELCQKKL